MSNFFNLFRIVSFCLCLHFCSVYTAESQGNGMRMLDHSAKKNQYVFLFFYKEQNPRTMQAQQILDQTLQSLNTPIQTIKVNVTDPEEKAIVAKYQVQRAPMPLVLVI